MRDYLAAKLAEGGRTPRIDPGPANLASLQKLSPQEIVFLDVGGGAGLALEYLFDQPFIGTHVVGRQGDYDGAESLAELVDTAFLLVDSNATIGTAEALYITRTGGRPHLIGKDVADRYHFGCSYIAKAVTGF